MRANSMTWEKLLSTHRYKEGPTRVETSRINVFQEDASRILNSTPFRRLQGKTQVHPFPQFDYLRTRLTHSIEAAHIGRMITTSAMREMADPFPNGFEPSAAGDIVYAACLAHDLGNPPFGHIGEYAIQTWFQRLFETNPVPSAAAQVAELKADPRRHDFLKFDGNAQNFRILTRLTGWRDRGGLQLSYATLGAFAKYPRSSRNAGDKNKFGYMHDDKGAAADIFGGLGMLKIAEKDEKGEITNPKDAQYRRHPFAYIVEAADDISYLTTDVEDAGRMELIEFDQCEQLLRSIADTRGHLPRYLEIPKADKQDRLKYLRAAAVSTLVDRAVECFLDKEEDLLCGGFRENIFAATNLASEIEAIREACHKDIYNESSKLQLESAGFEIIMKIMDLYGATLLRLVAEGEDKLDKRQRGLYELLPKESRKMLKGADIYEAMLILVDYVSGMTDRYILDLYQKLTGTSPSIGRMM